jgi:hypothetical protein
MGRQIEIKIGAPGEPYFIYTGYEKMEQFREA